MQVKKKINEMTGLFEIPVSAYLWYVIMAATTLSLKSIQHSHFFIYRNTINAKQIYIFRFWCLCGIASDIRKTLYYVKVNCRISCTDSGALLLKRCRILDLSSSVSGVGITQRAHGRRGNVSRGGRQGGRTV